MAGRMGKALALRFCDFVSGPGLPGYREFAEWAEGEGFSDHRRSCFWSELALWVRDSGHQHAAHVMYRMAYVFASQLRDEQRFVGMVGEVFGECVQRFGVCELDIRKEDE
jgi:hypothetical protein